MKFSGVKRSALFFLAAFLDKFGYVVVIQAYYEEIAEFYRLFDKLFAVDNANALGEIWSSFNPDQYDDLIFRRLLSSGQSTPIYSQAFLSTRRPPCIMLSHGICTDYLDRDRSCFWPTNNYGLFSCLNTLIWGFLELTQLSIYPLLIDNSFSMRHFKNIADTQTWPNLFNLATIASIIEYKKVSPLIPLPYDHHSDYHSIVSHQLGLSWLKIFFKTYMTPSSVVSQIVDKFKKQCLIGSCKTLAVCIRGTDKALEVRPDPVQNYIAFARHFLNENEYARIIIQTDQSQIRDLFVDEFGNQCSFISALPVTSGNKVLHLAASHDPSIFCRNLIAMCFALSSCDHVLTHTGNVGCYLALLTLMKGNQLTQFQ